MGLPSRRAERIALALALVVTTTLLIALQPPSLEHWDEVQIELGMRRFDLAFHQPHPPGYVLFVLAGRFVGFVTRVAHPGRVLSLVATLAWIALTVARLPPREDFRHPRVRLLWPFVFPLLVLLSPTLLVHATTGRTYLVESTMWLAVLFMMTSASSRTALGLGALIGVAGGFRPTVLLWGLVAIPFWLWSHRDRLRLRTYLELFGALVVAVAAWVSALAVLSGGIARYRALSEPLVRGNILAKSIFFAGIGPIVSERLPAMLLGVWSGMGPLVLITGVLLVMRLRRTLALEDLDPLLWGSLLAFAFYLAMIYDADGYSLSYLLPLVSWTIVAGARLAARARPLFIGSAVSVVCGGFLVMPGGLASPEGILAARARLKATHDARMEAIDAFPAASTLVVVGQEKYWGWSFRSVMYDRPGVGVLQLVHDPFVFGTNSPERPYLFAREHATTAAGPDGFDVATLFPSDRPLRTVIFSTPKEISARVGSSCAPFARALDTRTGERLLRVDVGPHVRVHVARGMLQCAAGSSSE